MRKALIAANWKMNGSSESVSELLEAMKNGFVTLDADRVEVAICPPSLYVAQVAALLKGGNETDAVTVAWGGQNIYPQDAGAFTGEISVPMLADLGSRYVIVGHSERRELFAETDQQVAEKFAAVQAGGLIPILCVGETLQQREAGITDEVVGRQIQAVLDHSGAGSFASAVVAYEPVWAIGTGLTASPEQAQQVHGSIRGLIAAAPGGKSFADDLQVLYGGSVKAGNAAELFGQPDIDGGLVGGASLNAEEFIAICQSV